MFTNEGMEMMKGEFYEIPCIVFKTGEISGKSQEHSFKFSSVLGKLPCSLDVIGKKIPAVFLLSKLF